MPRPPKNPDAPGVFNRGGWYWLRHTINGKEIRQPLRTQIYEEAITKARELRGRAAPETAKGSWVTVIERYLKEKQNPRRPAGFAGKRWQTMRPGTVLKVRSCLKTFATWSDLPSPSKVTLPILERYLEKTSKTSKAGGRTTLATINAFLAHVGCLPGRIQLPAKKELERRQVVVTIGGGNELIEKAQSDNLRFILYCGFHAGLRRGEIMHARPAWFDMSRRVLTVPRVDEVEENKFQIKDDESRDIPLSKQFSTFLRDFLPKIEDGYCLKNPTKRRSKSGTYDFCLPFSKFAAACGKPELYPHAMRHSWISELCNSGNHSIQEVSAWSGDTIETIEKNYWHKRVVPGALDDTMQGKRSGDTIKEVAATLKTISTAGLDKETAAAVKKLLKAAEKAKEPDWDWTAKAPAGHVRLYSVEDTVSKIGVFRALVEPEEKELGPLRTGDDWEYEWEDGLYSTVRSRLNALQQRGWIEQK